MSQIDELSSALAKVNRDLLARWTAPSAEGMAAIADALAPRFGPLSRRQSSALNSSRSLEAVRMVRDHKAAVDFRTLRVACHGISQPFDGYVLLGDPVCLRALLDAISSYRREPRRFRRLYEGLLSSYLTAERRADWFADNSIHEGPEHLRAFLQDNVDVIRSLEPAPVWVGALADYPEILELEPGRRFGDAWIAGNRNAFQDAIQRLGLPGTSWLAGETIQSALAIALGLDDHAFSSHISAFLETAEEPRFQPLRDSIYVDLIGRYAAIPCPSVHAQLRDALVSAWKNPWLERNDPAWTRVPDAARKMVAGWLKLDLIHQFFEVLSEDGRQDKSRFEFWRTYHHQMDDVYFALGSRSFWSRNPDIEKLRRAMDGRLIRLNDPNGDNNAFIMRMGDTIVVEFSQKGNAAYFYRATDLPLDDGVHTTSTTGLKRDHPGRQMRHAWARGLSWQQQFERVLGEQQATISAGPSSWRQQTGDANADITSFARANGISFEDHTSKGGNLWLIVDDADADIVRQITKWGFKYRPGRGWWRSDA